MQTIPEANVKLSWDNLTLEDLNLINEALNLMPYGRVERLINKFRLMLLQHNQKAAEAARDAQREPSQVEKAA